MRGQKEAEDDSEGSRRVFWLGVEGRQQRADMAAGGPAILTPPPTLPKAASSRHHGKTRLRCLLKQRCNAHWGACIFSNYGLLQIYAQEWDC